MSQSRLSSLTEAIVSTAVGFLISMCLTAVVLPLYGHTVTWGENAQITAIFTIFSIARSYLLRRWFNASWKRPAVEVSELTRLTPAEVVQIRAFLAAQPSFYRPPFHRPTTPPRSL